MGGRSLLMAGVTGLAVATLVAAGLASVPVAADGNDAPGNPPTFRAISAGSAHTCALIDNGIVKCWGSSSSGQLGQSDRASRGDAADEMGLNLPAVSLGGGRTATAIAAGGEHTCALLDNATVKCWGDNGSGQLGLGDTADRGDNPGEMGDDLPAVALGTGRSATAISAGGDHTCARLDNGTVKCWGENAFGRLGQGDINDRGDNPGEMGDDLPAVALGTGRTAASVTAGSFHTCALLDNGTVRCWGANSSGKLGLGDTANRGDGVNEMGDNLPAVALGTGRTATAVSADSGSLHTCVRLDNAAVKCWGENGRGQLGLGDTADRGDSAGEMGDSLPAVTLGTGRTVAAVTAGGDHTCARLDDATLKCWGLNFDGQLGLGDISGRGDGAGEMGDSLPAVSLGSGRTLLAVTGGGLHTCALLDNAAVKCWGRNVGSLGLGDTDDRGDDAGEMGDNLPAVDLVPGPAAASPSAVIAGRDHTCALLFGGTVKCWGDNAFGQLGLGNIEDRGDEAGEMGANLPAVALGSGRAAVAVAAGGAHTCAILDNGTVKCWGLNDTGQLGLGDMLARGDDGGEMGDSLPAVSLGPGRTAVAIAAGSGHTCAILDNATVKCWGGNSAGQLGQGDQAPRGDAAGEMGANLPAVALGTGRTATAVTSGTAHTCARLDNDTVKCWGLNDSGQLGLGDPNSRGDGAGEMGDNLPAVALGSGRTARAVSATGAVHTCAVLDNATVKCWGSNLNGRLGQGDTASRGVAAGEMGDNLPAVSLGTGRTATRVATGAFHSCARLDNGSVKCWGNSSFGELGVGSSASRGDAAGEMGDNLPAASLGTGRTAAAISANGAQTCALLDNVTVKCWGQNAFGELGQGDDANRGSAPGQMGDSLPAIDVGTPPLVAAGSFTVAQTADETSVIAGATVHLHVTVTNTGSIALHNVTVVDAKAPGCDGNLGTIGVGANATVNCTHTATAGDLPTYTNTATVDSDETSPSSSNPVNVTVTAPSGTSGTITDAVSAAPVAGAFVAALRTTDFSLAGGAAADGSGNYTVTLVPGSYFLYLVDPTGAHTAAFAGAPTLITVPAGTIVDADATMAPTRGSLSGTVTETGPNTAIGGTWAIALNNTGIPERGIVANGAGAFTLPGLNPGNHFIGYVDPTGAHSTRFFPNSPNVPDANTVAVSAGGNTAANGTLPTQTAVGTGAALTGTVTEQGTGAPVPGAFVMALHAADLRIARGAVANAQGVYSLDVVAGPYKLAFIDPAGLHHAEWHDNQPITNLAGAASVAAPTATNAALGRTTGSMSGTVTDDPTGNPIAGAWVLALGPTGIAGGAITAANGTYTVTGLPPGTYRATFVDPNGGHAQEYFDNAPDFSGATPFNITAAADTNINGAITVP